MRIGELAALAGVTTRAVRHYHHLGLLPEPERRANGYRHYTLRDAVELARIRRLSELGLSLEEVRDVLADDYGRELREVLAELDADLARQEDELKERRAHLAELLSRDYLSADEPISPVMASLFTALPNPPKGGLLAKERDWLAVLDTAAPVDVKIELMAVLSPMALDHAVIARVNDLYSRMDALTDPADPAIPELAERLLELFPPGIGPTDGDVLRSPFGQAFLDDLTEAQAAVIRHAFTLLRERGPE
ncbi:MerR family transcriptional regulator [Nonomuraea sp. NPDC050310]|uniref:MerR family transcriptional regulator n=1 Tax=unclassified Nonomuraea TaxID=2593643 RepID=UPI0033F23D97